MEDLLGKQPGTPDPSLESGDKSSRNKLLPPQHGTGPHHQRATWQLTPPQDLSLLAGAVTLRKAGPSLGVLCHFSFSCTLHLQFLLSLLSTQTPDLTVPSILHLQSPSPSHCHLTSDLEHLSGIPAGQPLLVSTDPTAQVSYFFLCKNVQL